MQFVEHYARLGAITHLFWMHSHKIWLVSIIMPGIRMLRVIVLVMASTGCGKSTRMQHLMSLLCCIAHNALLCRHLLKSLCPDAQDSLGEAYICVQFSHRTPTRSSVLSHAVVRDSSGVR